MLSLRTFLYIFHFTTLVYSIVSSRLLVKMIQIAKQLYHCIVFQGYRY